MQKPQSRMSQKLPVETSFFIKAQGTETTTSRQLKEEGNETNSEIDILYSFGMKTKYHRLRRFLVVFCGVFFLNIRNTRCLFLEFILFCTRNMCGKTGRSEIIFKISVIPVRSDSR